MTDNRTPVQIALNSLDVASKISGFLPRHAQLSVLLSCQRFRDGVRSVLDPYRNFEK